MDLQAHEDCTGYAPRGERWYAIDADTYDGADDAGPQMMGHGSTEKEAMMDLIEQMLDAGEITHDEQYMLLAFHHIDPREVGYDG